MFAILIYLGYLSTLGVIFERMFIYGSYDKAPDSYIYVFCRVYVWFLALLFLIKLVYYTISLYAWCNTRKDPYKMLAIGKFRMLITLGLYQFILFIIGFILYINVSTTYKYIGKYIINGFPGYLIMMTIFKWILVVHASLYTLYFFFYLLFICYTYYHFKKYNGF